MSLGCGPPEKFPLSPQDFHSGDKKGTLDSSFQSPGFAVVTLGKSHLDLDGNGDGLVGF